MTFATILTLVRIALIPVMLFLVAYDYVILSFTLYIFLILTDFFDGYFARKMNQTSALGAFLDPIADKLLVAALLIIFCADQTIAGIWLTAPIIIILREIWIPGLRGFIGYDAEIMAVSKLAKWKTTTQMVSLCFLLLAPAYESLGAIGLILLSIAALLTFITAYDYTKKGWSLLTKGDNK